MGVTTYLQKKKSDTTNRHIKGSFFFTLNFWGSKKTNWQPKVVSHLLGTNKGFCIINPEYYIEMFKRIIKVCLEISRKKGQFLFVNTLSNTKLDGILKTLAFRAGQSCIVGKWACGSLTKTTTPLKYDAIILLESNQSNFIIKEANKIGIPIISLNNNSFNPTEVMYPLLCNNQVGDSVFYNMFAISNTIIEGILYNYIKFYVKK